MYVALFKSTVQLMVLLVYGVQWCYFYDLQFTTNHVITSFHSCCTQFYSLYIQGGRLIQVTQAPNIAFL